jgi:hypothetical protein
VLVIPTEEVGGEYEILSIYEDEQIDIMGKRVAKERRGGWHQIEIIACCVGSLGRFSPVWSLFSS